jgi:hypothetical protein
MTTRRWMVVVATLAVALGGYLEVARLIHRRAEFRQRAKVHAALEAYYRKINPTSAYVARRKKVLDRERDLDLAGFEEDRETAFRRLTERMLGRSTDNSAPSEEQRRFQEAQTRARMLRLKRRLLAEHHLALRWRNTIWP